MKIDGCLFVLIGLLAMPAYATSGSADVIGQGQGEIGVFRPLRLGLSPRDEVQVQPLAFFVLPHMTFKHLWFASDALVLSSEHRLSYPTLALKMLRRPGIGGLVEREGEVPELVASQHGILVSHQASTELQYTFKAGLGAAARFASGQHWHSIEAPIIFARTASYHKGVTVHLGLDIDYALAPKWALYVETDLFRTAYAKARWHFEEAIMFRWFVSQTSRVEFGVKLSSAQYLYGKQTHILPLVDWVWDFEHGWVW